MPVVCSKHILFVVTWQSPIEVEMRIMQEGFIFRARYWNSQPHVSKKKSAVTVEVMSRAHKLQQYKLLE
jgi:hypothetical protein